MNTQEIQQIVRELALAKDGVREFADSSVGQFRQFQSAMSALVQVAGDQLDGLSGQFGAAGQEVSGNAVPLLQEAVDTLLGDLGRLGDLGDVIPGGEKLGGAVETLTTALGGLSGFLAENGDLIGKIGLSEEHTQRIAQVASNVLTVRSHLAEVGKTATAAMDSIKGFTGMLGKAGEAVPALNNVLGTAGKGLQNVGAIGATAFIGWEIGKVIGEVTGLNRKLSELAENRALKNQKSDWEQFEESWVSAHGGLDKVNRNGETAREVYERKFGPDRDKAKKRGEGTKAEVEEKTPPPEASPPPAGEPATGPAEAEETAAEEVAKEREETRQEQQTQDEAAIGDRKAFADQASETIVAGGKQLAQAEKTASAVVLQARAETAQGQAKANANRVGQLRDQGRQLAAADRQATGKAQAAWNALLQPGTRKEARKARKEQQKQARQRQKAEARLERQVAAARRREAELERAGLTTQEARRRMTTRGRELLKADDLRRDANKASDAAGNQRQGTGKTHDVPLSPPAGGVPPAEHPAFSSTPPQSPAPAIPLADPGILRELQNHSRLLERIAAAEGVK